MRALTSADRRTVRAFIVASVRDAGRRDCAAAHPTPSPFAPRVHVRWSATRRRRPARRARTAVLAAQTANAASADTWEYDLVDLVARRRCRAGRNTLRWPTRTTSTAPTGRVAPDAPAGTIRLRERPRRRDRPFDRCSTGFCSSGPPRSSCPACGWRLTRTRAIERSVSPVATVVVLQPGYLPWLGFFDQLRRADVFVYYDDVQYDKHGWRNRNRIKTQNGAAVADRAGAPRRRGASRGSSTSRSTTGRRGRASTWRASGRRTRGRRFSTRYLPALEELLQRKWERLVDLDLACAALMAGWFGLQHARSSDRRRSASAASAASGW